MKIELVIGIDPGLIQTGIYYQNADGSFDLGTVNPFNYSDEQAEVGVFDRLTKRLNRIELDGEKRVVVGIELPSHRNPQNKEARRMALSWYRWVEEMVSGATIVFFIQPREWQDELPPETVNGYISGLRRRTLVEKRKARSIEHFNSRPGRPKRSRLCIQDDVTDAFAIFECARRRSYELVHGE